MSNTIDMRPEIEQTVAAINRAVTALPLDEASRVGEDLGIDTVTPYNDGTPLTSEDIAALIEGRLIDLLVSCGLANVYPDIVIAEASGSAPALAVGASPLLQGAER